eukprot:gb/GECG01013646.1/.p1 GENE.gb/GECG01013646.1/~~gb/GECG01013646.1/.p1  ORF type:complete len:356 (+),score=56.02 gb/GECG01013646.1/:1-1068(+)
MYQNFSHCLCYNNTIITTCPTNTNMASPSFEATFGQGTLGMTVDDTLKVVHILQDGPAAAQGVHLGDALCKANGQEIQHLTRNEAVEKIRQAERPLRLEFKRSQDKEAEGPLPEEKPAAQSSSHSEQEHGRDEDRFSDYSKGGTDDTGTTFGSKLGKESATSSSSPNQQIQKKKRSSGVQALAQFGRSSFKRMQRSISGSSSNSPALFRSLAGVNSRVPESQLPKDDKSVDREHEALHTLRKSFDNKFARTKIVDDHIISLHNELSHEVHQTVKLYKEENSSWNKLYGVLQEKMPQLQASIKRINRTSTLVSNKLEDVERQVSIFRCAVLEAEVRHKERDIKSRMDSKGEVGKDT